MATEYSLAEAFKRIEEELIKSMIRNFEKHKAEELDEGFNWDQWQVVQLRELERYRKQNLEKFGEEFEILNGELEDLLRMTSEDAETEEEARILREIGEGLFPEDEEPGMSLGAFGINEDKLNSLIKSTTDDLEKAEHAVLRRSNDIYRQVIHDAQVYAASGGTYEQAVDMATKDFARRGITSIVYKNGSRHTIQDYASMAIRTAMKRAYLMGEGQKNAEYGIHTVRVNKRQGACPLCLRWVGKVLIDDVYGGGTKEEAREKRLPLLSTAMAKGFLHPNCKDVYSLYIEGVSQPAEPWSEYDLRVLADQYNYEQKEKHAKAMIESWTRVAETRLAPENKRKAEALADGWRNTLDELQKGRAAGGDTPPADGYNKKLGKIDFDNKDQIEKILDNAQKRFTGLEHEEGITILKNGEVWQSVSAEGRLPTDEIPGDHAGSYSYHVHPTQLTNYSFGEEDVASFVADEEEYAKASDELFEYIMERLPETKSGSWDEVYHEHKDLYRVIIEELYKKGEKDRIEQDAFHEVVLRLAEKYGFKYERRKL